MAFDALANFAYSTVATAPGPATSGTSLTVAAGNGALFPAPPFNATVWPAGIAPTTANAEIVRVTGISTDTLTIVRAQEGSTAESIAVGWQISATITAKTLTDIQKMLNGTNQPELNNPLLLGNSGVPTTPAAGLAVLFGIGTSNLQPGWLNESGTQENIITNGGTAANIQGLVAARQGGTTGNNSWNTAGTSNTTVSTTPVMVQVGSVTSSSSAGVTVTFPNAFTQAPLVFLTPVNGSAVSIAQLTGFPSTTSFVFVVNNNGGTQIAVNTLWAAIGQ